MQSHSGWLGVAETHLEEIDPWRVYNIEDARSLLAETGLDVDALAPQVKDRFASAFIRARKPAAGRVLRPRVLLMIRFSIALALLTAPVASSFAQDPYAVAPQAYKKQFENEFVRVTRVHYAPHEQLTEHAHPAKPTIYIYLKDGGPVLFKHEHGDSGAMAATRPATKAGAYRIALGRNETHFVDNQSDLPSDFLQVELKTEIDPKTFNGWRFRDPSNVTTNVSKLEFDTDQMRIIRITCTESAACHLSQTPHSVLEVAIATGDTTWLPPDAPSTQRPAGECLRLEFKGGHDGRP